MTPTPEDIALALETVKRFYPEMRPSYRGRRYQIALTAIMEVREKAATFLDATPHTYTDPISGVNIRTPQLLATAIRNGEHLR